VKAASVGVEGKVSIQSRWWLELLVTKKGGSTHLSVDYDNFRWSNSKRMYQKQGHT
jgi:hypothetical protein